MSLGRGLGQSPNVIPNFHERKRHTSMRLDKYLKVSRLIKRRTVANEAASLGRVTLNGREAKPSAEVKVGDVLSLRLGGKTLTVRINSIQEHAAKADASDMYTVQEGGE